MYIYIYIYVYIYIYIYIYIEYFRGGTFAFLKKYVFFWLLLVS